MAQLPSVHPGDILREDFLKPLNMTPYRLARDIGVQPTRIGQILDGKRAVTVDTALRLQRYFGLPAKFWLDLQTQYDIETVERDAEKMAVYERIRPLPRPDLEEELSDTLAA